MLIENDSKWYEKSSLINNILISPMDNYTHNKYINKLRQNEGVAWGK